MVQKQVLVLEQAHIKEKKLNANWFSWFSIWYIVDPRDAALNIVFPSVDGID
jgi:hypothetical protein